MRHKLIGLISTIAALLSITTQRVLAACGDQATGSPLAGAQCAQVGGSPTELGPQITNIVNMLLLGIGVVAVIMLIIGGFRYIFSQGNEKNISGAKDTILYAVVGIVVSLLSYAIVNFIIGRF